MIKQVRLVFVTGHEFGAQALRGIVSSDASIEGLIEIGLAIGLDSKYCAGTVGYRHIGDLAEDSRIPFEETTDGTLRSLRKHIDSVEPDFIAVIGWSRLVDPGILKLARGTVQEDARGEHSHFGGIGMHPTRLPLGRGQAPIPWTIIHGVNETALSVFLLTSEADAGPILQQYPLRVRARETAASLFYRFAQLHYQAGEELARALTGPVLVAHRQNEELATIWPRRRPSDGELRSSMSKDQVARTVRALLGPYPRAFISMGERRVPVSSTVPFEESRRDFDGILMHCMMDQSSLCRRVMTEEKLAEHQLLPLYSIYEYRFVSDRPRSARTGEGAVGVPRPQPSAARGGGPPVGCWFAR